LAVLGIVLGVGARVTWFQRARRAATVLALCAASVAHAEPPRGPQLQIDLGAGVVGVGLEAQVSDHLAWQMEAIGTTTLYLKYVGGGTNTLGYGAGTRLTWLQKRDGTGLYVAGALRFVRGRGERDGDPGHGLVWLPAVTLGQAFHATKTVDLRFGFGAQWIHYDMRTKSGPLTADVPFIMVELLVGIR